MDSLPSELLMDLLTRMGLRELCSLSATSRRMNELIINLGLKRYGFHNPSKALLFSGQKWDALPLLRLAVSMKPTQLLSCVFPQGPQGNIFQTVTGIHRILANMPSVEKMIITFTEPGVSNQMRPVERTKAFEAILNLFDTAMKKGCASLEVFHDCYPVYNPPKVQSFRPLGQLSRTRPPHSSETKPSELKLRSFEIQSRMLLRPPLADWTHYILNTAPITSLILRKLDFQPDRWRSFLQNTTLSQLTHLAIDATGLDLGDLVRFLLRHPLLTSLEILDREYLWNPSWARRPLLKAKLSITHLQASPTTLYTLLYHQKLFENIATVTASSRLPCTFVAVEALFLALSAYTNDISLTLTLSPSAEGLERWMRTIIDQAPKSRIERKLTCVRTLRLDAELGACYTYHTIAMLPEWVALFPNVRTVEVGCSAVSSLFEHEMGMWEDKFRETCPGLEQIRVDYDGEDTSRWFENLES